MSFTTKPISLFGTVSLLSVLYVMSATATTYDTRQTIADVGVETYSGDTFSGLSLTDESVAAGGAIFNEGTLTINNGTTFTGNSVTANGEANGKEAFGGAICNAPGGIINLDNTTFTDNHANATGSMYSNYANGGAIYNDGALGFSGTNVFRGNSASRAGGAIYTNTSLTIGNATFENNSAGVYGGAIYHGGADTDLVVESSTFNGNDNYAIYSDSGAVSGVLVSLRKGTVSISDSSFTNNEDPVMTLYRNGLHIDNTEFINNSGYSTVYGMYTTNVELDNLTFRDNTPYGGLIDIMDAGLDSQSANLTISNITMENNTIGGSAIEFGAYHPAAATVENITIDNNVSNYGVVMGVWGDVDTEITNITITNNKKFDDLMVLGRSTNFNGTNTFLNNGWAEIRNWDIVTFKNGSTTTMDRGGIYGSNGTDKGGTVIVENGATLNLGVGTVRQKIFTLNGVVNGELSTDPNVSLSFDVFDTFDGTGELNLSLGGIGTYKVFEDKVFDHEHVRVIDSPLLTYSWNNTWDTITVGIRPADELVTNAGLSPAAAQHITAVSQLGQMPDNETLDRMFTTMSYAQIEAWAENYSNEANAREAAINALLSGNTEYIEKESAKSAPAQQAISQSVATAIQGQTINLAGNRMSIMTPYGRSGGDIKADFGVWAQGLFNKSQYTGKFDSNTVGVALGADVALNRHYMVGVGYAFNKSKVDADNIGHTDVDTHNVFLYGQYKPSQWFVNAVLNYAMSSYKESIKQYGLLEIGGEYDVNTFGGQIATGYDFRNCITPELGLRYMHVTQDDYERSHYDMRIAGADGDFMTSVIGVKYAPQFKSGKSWIWSPELRAAAKYDILSDEMESTVTMPAMTSYVVRGERLSRVGGEFGLGITGKWRDVELSLNYDLDVRKDFTSHTGMVKLRYEF